MISDVQDLPITFDDVQTAAEEIKPYIHCTPIVTSTTADAIASSSLNNVSLNLVMKCENLQKIGGTFFDLPFSSRFALLMD